MMLMHQSQLGRGIRRTLASSHWRIAIILTIVLFALFPFTHRSSKVPNPRRQTEGRRSVHFVADAGAQHLKVKRIPSILEETDDDSGAASSVKTQIPDDQVFGGISSEMKRSSDHPIGTRPALNIAAIEATSGAPAPLPTLNFSDPKARTTAALLESLSDHAPGPLAQDNCPCLCKCGDEANPTGEQPFVRLQASKDSQAVATSLFAAVYVINLEKRTDRREYMHALLRYMGLSATFVAAVNSNEDEVKRYSIYRRTCKHNPRLGPDPRVTKEVRFLKRAEIACWMSHRRVWREVLERQISGPVLVLEDDIDLEMQFERIVANSIASLPQGWDFLWTGHCFEDDPALDRNRTQMGPRTFTAVRPGCTHSYVLNGMTAAGKLVAELGQNVTFQVDNAMSNLVKYNPDLVKGYSMIPPPVVQLARLDRKMSDIKGNVQLPYQWCMESVRKRVKTSQRWCGTRCTDAADIIDMPFPLVKDVWVWRLYQPQDFVS